ncbi:hypothetical protein IV77_GL000887 [Olsenella uli DSM 7084]|nr:hypothetical protein IV77_GL000887 [Olsenella uli DSM 7084]
MLLTFGRHTAPIISLECTDAYGIRLERLWSMVTREGIARTFPVICGLPLAALRLVSLRACRPLNC